MSNSTWAWISGWAVCPKRFKSAVERSLPEYSHEVLAPTSDAFEAVLESDAICIGGYSLGSLMILSELNHIPITTKVICLAPFISFCKENQLGGTTPRSSLQMLQRRLKAQPNKTLRLFYRLAGLDDEPWDNLPYELEHLEWGLEQLACLKADIALLHRAKGFVGLTDSLIDPIIIKSKWTNCQIIEQCNHAYPKLLDAFSQFNMV